MKLTFSSLPGAGSSTVARLLAKKLRIKHVDAGEIWDKMAKERKIDLMGLTTLAEKDKSIDLELDKKMLGYAKDENDLILEGRLCGWQCYKNKIPAFKIWLKCHFDVRAKRLAAREKKALLEIFKETKKREESEAKRYKNYYDIDINDLSIYDLIIDSSKMTPGEIVGCILKNPKFKITNHK
ncbi:MAG: (d)CMP kinase [Patescibacteria group bacterium]